MRIATALLVLLFSQRSWATCEPADAKAIAEAERRVSDTRQKAEQAEATAVKSGNPGAALRAKQARAEAAAAEKELGRLECKDTGAPKASSVFQNP